MSQFELLEVVVLSRDLPEYDLRAGDAGTIVEVYDDSNFEVEFIEASGKTRALLTLSSDDIRAVVAGEMLTVRESAPPYN